MPKASIGLVFGIILSILFLSACEDNYSPKPRAYPKIDFPERQYQKLSLDACPIVFEFPVFAEIHQRSTFADEEPEHPCWMNIYYPQFDATIYLSYKELQNYDLDKLREEAHRLTYQHTHRADYIDPYIVSGRGNVGIVYEVGGDAASATQFFISDTISHFIRGALYFNVAPNIDSLKPVVDFINEDIRHLISTVNWD